MQRRENIDDMNTVSLNFIGGIDYPENELMKLCPMDKLVLAYGSGRDSQDMFKIASAGDYKAESEENMVKIYKEVVVSLIKKKVQVIRKFNQNPDKSAAYVGQKYHKDLVIKQFDWALKMLIELSDIEGAEDLEAVKDERLKRARRLKISKEREQNFKIKVEDDFDRFEIDLASDPNYKHLKGWENFPRLCLRILHDCPYLHDQLKTEVLRWEVTRGQHRYRESALGTIAGITGQLLRACQGHMKTQQKAKVIWLYGYLGHEDFEALFEMIEPGLRNL